jgi:hypothetical protein
VGLPHVLQLLLMLSLTSLWKNPDAAEECGKNAEMGMGQNLVPLVNIKIAGKWMFIPLKMYL